MSGADDLGFSFCVQGATEVKILRAGRVVTVLREGLALDFVAAMANLDAGGRQQAMARVTGNYKRGNERRAAQHPRNRSSRNG